MLAEAATGRKRLTIGRPVPASIMVGGWASVPDRLALGASAATRPLGASVATRPLGLIGRSALLIILGLDVRDMEESIAPHRKIDERRLNRGFDVDDFSFIDIPGITLVAGPFNVELFEYAVLDDCDSAFLRLEHVDQHFFLHAVSFWNNLVRGVRLGLILAPISSGQPSESRDSGTGSTRASVEPGTA
jgi:hypothetical protein